MSRNVAKCLEQISGLAYVHYSTPDGSIYVHFTHMVARTVRRKNLKQEGTYDREREYGMYNNNYINSATWDKIHFRDVS